LKSSESERLAELIKARAYALGFALCGITTPDSPDHLDEYQSWLTGGLHAEMEYMATDRARERRADPRTIFPDCKSILVLAANYYQGESTSSETGGEVGRVARYAWGRDYHDVLMGRLKELISYVQEEVGRPVSHRLYTDTGPLMERELAQRAGLGWIGKNTMLINTDVGSWTLLAEAMLDLALPADEPFRSDHCGSCTRCLDACPTKAILPDPRRIDSRRCISYLTIEHRGVLPTERREYLGDWMFGCDICQDVCPWNQHFAQPQSDPDFALRDPSPHMHACDVLALSQREFSNALRGSALKRAKRGGLLRNAVVALGNTSGSRAVPYLERALYTDPDPVVRGHAAWALAQCSAEIAPSALRVALESEKDVTVIGEIEAALEVVRGVRESASRKAVE
jgi:epoxyqueuosine reductase